MRKIQISRFGGPEVLSFVEVPLPQPGPGDVLVSSHSIGVGWPDVYVRSGTYPWQHLFPLPATPGIEMAGNVAAVGSAVTQFNVGQPVYVSSRLLGFRGGCYTEAMLVPAESVVALPSDLPLDVAAGLAYYQLAVALLQECAQGHEIDWVVVSGASGGVGTALVQTAKACGYRVIATVGHEDKRPHALASGADHVLNYRQDDLKASLASITEGRGVDFWLESFVGMDMGQVMEHMALWGKVVFYNAVGGHPAPSFFDDWRRNMRKCVSVQYFSMHVYEDNHDALRDLLARAIGLMRSGAIRPLAPTVFPLAEATEAHCLLESGRSRGRIMLRA